MLLRYTKKNPGYVTNQGFPNSVQGWWRKSTPICRHFEHQLKSKLAWPVCTKSKINMVQEQWLKLKMKFLLVITWKLLFSEEGTNLWWGNKLFQVRGEWANFWLVGGTTPYRESPADTYNAYIYIYIYIYIYVRGQQNICWNLKK